MRLSLRLTQSRRWTVTKCQSLTCGWGRYHLPRSRLSVRRAWRLSGNSSIPGAHPAASSMAHPPRSIRRRVTACPAGLLHVPPWRLVRAGVDSLHRALGGTAGAGETFRRLRLQYYGCSIVSAQRGRGDLRVMLGRGQLDRRPPSKQSPAESCTTGKRRLRSESAGRRRRQAYTTALLPQRSQLLLLHVRACLH